MTNRQNSKLQLIFRMKSELIEGQYEIFLFSF